MSSHDSLKKGWIVTFAGTGVYLALGILYTWSIFRSEIQRSIIAEEGFEIGGFDWSLSAVNDPYAVCCLVFAFFMIPAGKFQDKLGPRLTTAIGGFSGSGYFFACRGRHCLCNQKTDDTAPTAAAISLNRGLMSDVDDADKNPRQNPFFF